MTGQAIKNIERIRELASVGKTPLEIATELGLCRPYVSALGKRNGVTFGKKRNPLVNRIRELADQGLTRQQVADEVGVKYTYISIVGTKNAISFRRQSYSGAKHKPDSREFRMASLYTSGKTLKEIGQEFGITRERVRQLLTKFFSLNAKDGGRHKTAAEKRLVFEAKRNVRSLKKWGCSYNDYAKLRDLRKPTLVFGRQKNSARQRGIEWDLTLWQWWSIWRESGHWTNRGRGNGYCMCRKGDQGPYSVDNVYIATSVENIQDYWANVRSGARERRARKPRDEGRVSA